MNTNLSQQLIWGGGDVICATITPTKSLPLLSSELSWWVFICLCLSVCNSTPAAAAVASCLFYIKFCHSLHFLYQEVWLQYLNHPYIQYMLGWRTPKRTHARTQTQNSMHNNNPGSTCKQLLISFMPFSFVINSVSASLFSLSTFLLLSLSSWVISVFFFLAFISQAPSEQMPALLLPTSETLRLN